MIGYQSNLINQTGDSGRRGNKMRKMTEGRMMMKGRKWTGMNKEATKPYLKEENT